MKRIKRYVHPVFLCVIKNWYSKCNEVSVESNICMSRPQKKLYVFINDVKFTFNGNVVESVKSWPHLWHIIACKGDDGDDIDRCRYQLIRQINDVICIKLSSSGLHCENRATVSVSMDVGYGNFNVEVLKISVCHGGRDWVVLGDYRVAVVQLLLIFRVIYG